MTERTVNRILQEILTIPGVETVVILSRDGFVIESAGKTSGDSSETIGATLATSLSAIEESARDLDAQPFRDLFVDYGTVVVLCRPLGSAVLAVFSTQACQLGVVRYRLKGPVAELSAHF